MNRLILGLVLVVTLFGRSAAFANTEHGYGLVVQRPVSPEVNEYAILYDEEPTDEELRRAADERETKARRAHATLEREFRKSARLKGALKNVILGGAKMFWESCWEAKLDRIENPYYEKLPGVLAYTTKEKFEGSGFGFLPDKEPVPRILLDMNPDKADEFQNMKKADRVAYHEKRFQETKLMTKKYHGWGFPLMPENKTRGHVKYEVRSSSKNKLEYRNVEIRGDSPDNMILRFEHFDRVWNGPGKRWRVHIIYCR